jgi:hypothetical protein
VGDLIGSVACLPAQMVITVDFINPPWNGGYVGALQRATVYLKAKACISVIGTAGILARSSILRRAWRPAVRKNMRKQ